MTISSEYVIIVIITGETRKKTSYAFCKIVYRSNSSMKKAVKIAVNVILWIFVAFSALTMILSLSSAASDGVPSIFGKSLISIQSDSMKPTFKEGDLLFVKPLKGVDRMTLKKDDVITFWADLDGDGNQELNTHRILEVINGDNYENENVSYRTQGDNPETNATPDRDLVLHSSVVGVWTGKKAGGLGSALDFLQSSTGFLVVIVLPLALFFIYELYNVISTVVSMKHKKAAITPEDEEEIKRKAVEEYLRQQAALGASSEKAEDKQPSEEEKEDSDGK